MKGVTVFYFFQIILHFFKNNSALSYQTNKCENDVSSKETLNQINALAKSYFYSQKFLEENEKQMVQIRKLIGEGIEKINENNFDKEFDQVILALSNFSSCKYL